MTVFISVAVGIIAMIIAFRLIYVSAIKSFGEDSIGIGSLVTSLFLSAVFAFTAFILSAMIIEHTRLSEISAEDCQYSKEISIEDIMFSSDSYLSISFVALDGTYQSTSQDNGKLVAEPSPDGEIHIISAYTTDEWLTAGCAYLLVVQVPSYDENQSLSDVRELLAKKRLDISGIDFIDINGNKEVNDEQ